MTDYEAKINPIGKIIKEVGYWSFICQKYIQYDIDEENLCYGIIFSKNNPDYKFIYYYSVYWINGNNKGNVSYIIEGDIFNNKLYEIMF